MSIIQFLKLQNSYNNKHLLMLTSAGGLGQQTTYSILYV